jgi:CrcB protein
MTRKLLLIALAGGLGSLARYALAGLAQRIGGASFPWGTVTVNIVGCFFAGFLWAMFELRGPVTPGTRLVVLVGFMGAFTTFSAFILETGELLRATEWLYAAGNIALQNVVGLIALGAGITLARLI